jgi:hypothetical protein
MGGDILAIIIVVVLGLLICVARWYVHSTHIETKIKPL